MIIQEQLLVEHSKANSNRIRDYIGNNPKRFRILIDLFKGDEYRISQRAAMVISACYDKNPSLFEPFKEELIKNILEKEPHIAVKRNTIRILQFMEIPDQFKAKMFDYSLERLYSEDEPIAVKAFAMQVAYNLCASFPELKKELEEAIHLNMENADSPGIRARGRTILKKLAKL